MNVHRRLKANPNRGRNSAAFPLTPALSLGEREKFCHAKERSIISNFIQSLL